MSEEITARCLCGAVRLACGSPVGPGGYCHCDDCRRMTGSAFSVTIPFDSSEFRVICGEVRSFTKTADSGNELTRHFCSTCGSPLYGTSPQYPERVYVTAGIIDQPTLIHPASQTWCQAQVAWSAIDPALPSFPRGKN